MLNNDEIEALLIKYEKYIRSIVKRFKVTPFDGEDLYQAGLLGLYKAIKYFQENKGVKLTTYAFKFILGEVSKEYTKLNIYGKKEYNRIRKYVAENNNKTTDELIADLKVSRESFFAAISSSDKLVYLSDDTIDLIKDQSVAIKFELTNDEELLWTYYVHYKMNQSEIAKKLKLSQATVSRKLKKIALKIKNQA